MTYKEELYKQCNIYLQKRENTVTTIITSHQKALGSETKSSAGDKHETGRAMLQLEMEKAGQQLHSIAQMKETMARVDITKKSELACLGSLITTNKHRYFLSISAGEIKIGSQNCYAISVSSPIGRQLLGKQKGQQLTFNGNTIEIIGID